MFYASHVWKSAAVGAGETYQLLTSRPKTTIAGDKPRGIVSADFNNDGKLDLATVNNVSGTLSVLVGTGIGAFSRAVTYSGNQLLNKIAPRFLALQSLDVARPMLYASYMSVSSDTGCVPWVTVTRFSKQIEQGDSVARVMHNKSTMKNHFTPSLFQTDTFICGVAVAAIALAAYIAPSGARKGDAGHFQLAQGPAPQQCQIIK